jgi:hypothetical protein
MTKRGRTAARGNSMATRTLRLRYHCVTVNAGTAGCPAALALKDVRILSEAAPTLPLAECTMPEDCRCTYRHHDDRRAGPRRADDRHERSEPWRDDERRRSVGRRATD